MVSITVRQVNRCCEATILVDGSVDSVLPWRNPVIIVELCEVCYHCEEHELAFGVKYDPILHSERVVLANVTDCQSTVFFH